MDILENINDLGEKISDNINDLTIDFKHMQESFLETTIGKIANSALDIGLKKILPDFVENDVIEIKDTILNEGFSEGVSKAVNNAIELGKSVVGIFTGNFESIEQAEKAIKEGGVIDGISEGIDFVLDKLENSKIISTNITDLIKCGKDLILNKLENEIDNEFSKETNSLSKINKSIDEWQKSYEAKDLVGINNNYSQIEKEIDSVLPIEDIIKKVSNIKNINNIINNSDDFSFDPVYLELAKSF